MIKVIMTKGLPGSGKSTWSRQIIDNDPNSYKRINKDDLRAMLDNGKHSTDSEKFILQVRDALILMSIEKGCHVIVDDTNLAPKHEAHIRELVKGKAQFEVMDFTEVSLEACIRNDLKRLNSVGEKVIMDMHNRYLAKKELYIELPALPLAIIVDVDGTLAEKGDRSPYDWSKVKEDTVRSHIKDLVNNYPGTVLIFSGRDGSCLKETQEWLQENEIRYHDIFMREAGNMEKDAIIKRRLFEEYVRGKYYIEYVLDDRDQVVKMWRDMGLFCLQVAEGNF